jgi:hypothetical protein
LHLSGFLEVVLEPTPDLIADAIYREKALRARRLSLQKRVETGAELSDLGREMMREAIRRENPSASQQQIHELVRRRIDLGRRLDNIPLPEMIDGVNR